MELIQVQRCLVCDCHHNRLLFTAGGWPILQCTDCCFVFLGTQPNWSSKKAINQQRYSQSLHLRSAAKTRMQERDDQECLGQICKYSRKGILLDIGCASGNLLALAQDQGWTVFGIELDPNLTAEAAKKVGVEKVHTGTSIDSPFPQGYFDVVVMRSVLEHIPDPRAELARVRTFLRAGGRLFILVPNIESFEGKLYRSRWFALAPGDHLWFFSPSTLRRLLEESGFSTVWMATTESYRDMFVGALFALWWIIKDKVPPQKRPDRNLDENPNERSTGFFATRFPAKLLIAVDTVMEVSRILTLPFFLLYSHVLQRRGCGASIRGIFVSTMMEEKE